MKSDILKTTNEDAVTIGFSNQTSGGTMGEGFDERRKGLEEEYFHRKNQEAIERLREKKK